MVCFTYICNNFESSKYTTITVYVSVMFHFEIVIGNESIGVLSFMNHPPYPSIPRNDRARSSQVLWSVVEVPRHRLARLKTSVSSSYITIFPRTRTEGERGWGEGGGGGDSTVDGRRKREANGFPVAVNETSINIPCFSLCSLRFFSNSPPIRFLFTYISSLPGGNKISTNKGFTRSNLLHSRGKRFISG